MNTAVVSTRGFTLIESLVALLVIGVAYTGVSTAVSSFTDQRLLLIDRHAGHRIAWNQLVEQRYQPSRVHSSKTKDTVNHLGRCWRWDMDIKKANGDGLKRYQANVYSGCQSVDKNLKASPVQASLSAYFVD